MAEGAIYDMFDPETHVVKELPQSFEKYVVGCDYGTASATSFVLLGLSQGTWYAIREYYHDSRQSGRQKTDTQYSRDMVRFLSGIRPRAIEVDPSAASFIIQLRRDSMGHIYEADNEVLEDIQVVSQALEGKRLLIHESCKHLVSQLATYSWDSAASKRGEDKPLKQNDHAVDALRYANMRAVKRGIFAVPTGIPQEPYYW